MALGEQFVIVRIGNEPYGININDVKEVVSNTEFTSILDKESVYICGITKCRYGCVSVFDIYRLFGVESFSPNRVMIILILGEKFLAFLAESVDGVINVPYEKIYDTPSILNDAVQKYMKKIILSDKRLIPIINTGCLFKKIGILGSNGVDLQQHMIKGG